MALTFAEIRFAPSRQWDGGPLGLGSVAPKMSWSGVGIHVHVATTDMAGKAGELYTPYSCSILSKTETNGYTAANVVCIDFDHIQMLVHVHVHVHVWFHTSVLVASLREFPSSMQEGYVQLHVYTYTLAYT